MSAALNPAAEAARLLNTIRLAEEAIKIACDHRSAKHAPGETIEETTARWNEAAEIETKAKACRKAARKALSDLRVFPDLRSPEQIAESIAAAKAAALALKAACDVGQRCHAARQIKLAARDLKRQISDCAAIAAGKAAEAAALGEANLGASGQAFQQSIAAANAPLTITRAQAAVLLRLLEDPAAYALVGWQEAMEEDRPEEIARWIADLDSSLRLLGSPNAFATLKRFQ
jgi:hypothetical protein